MAGGAVVDDGLIARSENEAPDAGSGNQEAVCGICVKLAWQKSAFGG